LNLEIVAEKPAEPAPFSPSSAKKVEDFKDVDVPEVTSQKPALADDPKGID
jgi:hypothetical protein